MTKISTVYYSRQIRHLRDGARAQRDAPSRPPPRASARPSHERPASDASHTARHVTPANCRRRPAHTRVSTVLAAAAIRERARTRTHARERGPTQRSDRDAFVFTHDCLERATDASDRHARGITRGDWCALGCLDSPENARQSATRRRRGRPTDGSPLSRPTQVESRRNTSR
jgi:hypothetical protein